MGISFSQLLFGAHTAMEVVAGGLIYTTGVASIDPVEGKKRSGSDKLWKRWHASGLLALGYVGLIGLGVVGDGKAKTKKFALETCGIFHGLAALAPMVALRDGLSTVTDATVLNLHLWMAAGFGALQAGWEE